MMKTGMMNFREWINEEVFSKSSIEIDFRDRSFTIWRNPDYAELIAALNEDKQHPHKRLDTLRNRPGRPTRESKVAGILTQDGEVYICGREYASHSHLADILKKNFRVGFYVNESLMLSASAWSTDEDKQRGWQGHPAIKAMFTRKAA